MGQRASSGAEWGRESGKRGGSKRTEGGSSREAVVKEKG